MVGAVSVSHIVSVGEKEKVLEVDGGDGCRTACRCLLPQNCMLKND